MQNLQDLEGEIWKRIPGYSLYEISNMGRLKTFNWKGCGRTVIMKPALDGNGYLRTMLKRDSDGKVCTIKVHRLVAITFIPNPENKPQVNHINAIRSDNRAENLNWMTHAENIKYSFTIGISCNKGENGPTSKLTYEEAKKIREKFTYGIKGGKKLSGQITRKMLAEEYGLSETGIKRILANKTYHDPTFVKPK